MRGAHAPGTRRPPSIALAVLVCGLAGQAVVHGQAAAPGRWAVDALAATGGPEHAYVVIVRDAGAGRANGKVPLARTLASIRFVDGQPTTQVRVYAAEVERLTAGVYVDDKPWLAHPRLRRDYLVGRVLGRAVAHEVGHTCSPRRRRRPPG